MARGRLIVVEGLDASGKRTQAEMLVRRLKAAGRRAHFVSFPAYGTPYGRLVKMYLLGEMGGREAVPPEAAAVLFALDRLQFKDMIAKLLADGIWVVADRYTQSNLYQAARVPAKKRARFVTWLERLEEPMPRADKVVLLDVPVRASRLLLRKRGRKKDVNEKDVEYLEEVRRVYLSQARRRGCRIISCMDTEGRLRGKADIAKEVWKAVA
ncbi:MAG: dTMP kinase [Candidatus Micrarchaeota archaeon]